MNLHGRVGSDQGYDVEATFAPPDVQGRIGGGLLGKNVHLTCTGEAVHGRIGGMLDGFDLHLKWGETTCGHLGGTFTGHHVTFTQQHGQITGLLGSELHGYPFRFSWQDHHLEGSIQRGAHPTEVTLTGDAPVHLLVGLALAAFIALADCGRLE